MKRLNYESFSSILWKAGGIQLMGNSAARNWFGRSESDTKNLNFQEVPRWCCYKLAGRTTVSALCLAANASLQNALGASQCSILNG